MSRVFFIFASILSFNSYAQSTVHHASSNSELSNSIARFFKLYPQEKAFLVTDNTAYLRGETIWYKIYLWNLSDEQISNAAYVVIRDTSGKELIKQNVLLVKGEGHGDFILPDSLPAGLYSLEVFTQWMANFYREPIASRLVWISDGRQTLTGHRTKLSDLMVIPEGGSLQCDEAENNIAVYPGMFATDGFTFELFDPEGRSVYNKRFKTHFGIAKVKLSTRGTYRARVCVPALKKCYDSLLVTNKPAIRLLQCSDKQVQLKIITPDEGRTNSRIFVFTEQRLLNFKELPVGSEDHILNFNSEEYPEGPIYFVLTDEEGIILSSRVIYNSKKATNRFSVQIENQEVDEDLIKLNVKIQAGVDIQESERIHVFIQPQNVVAGSFFLNAAKLKDEEYSLHDLMLFKKFNLHGAISDFLKTSTLPIKYSSHGKFNNYTNLNKLVVSPLEIVLAGFNNSENIDSIIAFKKDLKRINETYGYNDHLSYEKIASDETYFPGDYPSINNTIELLTVAIPRLKVKKVADSYSMSFLYTNLKGQKGLYDGNPIIIINGFKVSINFLKDLPVSDISSVEVLYNSRTIALSNLNTLFPYGAVFIHLTDGSAIAEKIEKEYTLFSKPFDWPHTFPGQRLLTSSNKVNTRLPFFNSLFIWNTNLSLNRQKAFFSCPLTRYNATSAVLFGFSLEDIKRNSHMEVKID